MTEAAYCFFVLALAEAVGLALLARQQAATQRQLADQNQQLHDRLMLIQKPDAVKLDRNFDIVQQRIAADAQRPQSQPQQEPEDEPVGVAQGHFPPGIG